MEDGVDAQTRLEHHSCHQEVSGERVASPWVDGPWRCVLRTVLLAEQWIERGVVDREYVSNPAASVASGGSMMPTVSKSKDRMILLHQNPTCKLFRRADDIFHPQKCGRRVERLENGSW